MAVVLTGALYLDDLAVGDEFRSGEYRVDAAEIVEFAQRYDPQVFHLDPAAAENTFFAGLSASGWHTAAITMRLLVASVPLGDGIIGVGGQTSWPRPVRPEDTLHVVTTIREITPSRSKPDRGMVTLECQTLNQHGEVCQKLTPTLVVTRGPQDGEPE